MPRPAVLGLTAAVLAAHLCLLQRVAPRLQPAPTARSAPFTVRSIVASPTPANVAPLARAGRPDPIGPGPARPVARLTGPARPLSAPSAALPEPAAEARAAPSTVSIPRSMQLRYQVTARMKQQTSEGTSELKWRHDGHSYEARFEVATPSSPLRVQHSAGRLGSDGLEPSRFGDRRRGEQATHFDRETRRVVFSNNRPAAPLAPGAQDRLSVLVQLAALVAGAPDRFPGGATVVIPTATTREAQAWVFTVDGEERLQLPGGERAAVKLTRWPAGEFDQRVEVWLDPAQAYVPVRLRLTQPNGDWADHQWSATDTP